MPIGYREEMKPSFSEENGVHQLACTNGAYPVLAWFLLSPSDTVLKDRPFSIDYFVPSQFQVSGYQSSDPSHMIAIHEIAPRRYLNSVVRKSPSNTSPVVSIIWEPSGCDRNLQRRCLELLETWRGYRISH